MSDRPFIVVTRVGSASAAAARSVPVEVGEATVGASVLVTFELDDPG